ncbi:hypothetical protein ACJMK2_022537 [Sinanodonta woodiana]|uniref:C-type lectin domain-containing protein n=1 Tax=Sinanodonta woodiana TaxID=1069815 RepID=A0ABD3TJC7_SINWO
MCSDLTKPFIKDDTSGHFYQVFDTKVTWKKASDLCKYDGGNLVTIESIEEQTFITDLIKKRTFTVPGLWIGSDKLHLDEQRAWANGEKMSYANWAPGEPNSHLIEENCLVIRTKDSTWMDVTCTERNGYICEISRT